MPACSQGSSVASERASGLVDTLNHNCTDPTAFGQLQIFRSAYKNKLLNAAEEANTSGAQDQKALLT